MDISSSSNSSTQFTINLGSQSGATKRTQGLSETAQKINDIANEAAAKRKALAAEQLKALRERLYILIMFSTLGSKGNAETAAQIAREIAATVKEYADASGVGANAADAATQGQGLNQEDEKFLNMAKQLSYQVKSIIAAEAEKARRKHQSTESHQAAISSMDYAIEHAEKTLRHDGQPFSETSFNGGTFSLLASSFLISA